MCGREESERRRQASGPRKLRLFRGRLLLYLPLLTFLQALANRAAALAFKLVW